MGPIRLAVVAGTKSRTDEVVKMIARSARVVGLLLCAACLFLPAVTRAADAGEDDRVWLGVLIDDESLDGGIHPIAVIPGGPAASAGLQRGDLLLEADDRGLMRPEDLEAVLSLRGPGDRLRLKVLRSGDTYESQVELTPRPSSRSNFRRLAAAPAAPPSAPLPPTLRRQPTRAASYGFTVADVTPDLRTYYGAPEQVGVLVTDVRPGRAADRAGLRVGDVLVQLGNVEVRRAVEVDDQLPVGTANAGSVVARVVRDNRSTVARLAVPQLRARHVTPVSAATGDEDFESLERLIHQEMDRLNRRLAELEQRLELLHEARESDPER